jgi:hypothetical protein
LLSLISSQLSVSIHRHISTYIFGLRWSPFCIQYKGLLYEYYYVCFEINRSGGKIFENELGTQSF